MLWNFLQKSNIKTYSNKLQVALYYFSLLHLQVIKTYL